MPISNVALTNTFDEWRTTTNQLVTTVNDILNDGSGTITYRNLTANNIFANNINISGSIINAVAAASFDKANAANVIASASFDKANAANVIASASFDKANAVNTSANVQIFSLGVGTAPTGNIGDIKLSGALRDSSNRSLIIKDSANNIIWGN